MKKSKIGIFFLICCKVRDNDLKIPSRLFLEGMIFLEVVMRAMSRVIWLRETVLY